MAIVVTQKYSIIGDFSYDNLIAGEQAPIIPKGVTLAAGQGVMARGTLLGIVTATGLAVMCDSTAVDGSQVPAYILGLQQGQLMDPTQTTIDTGAPGSILNVPAMAYQSGIFNRAAILTKAGQTADQFEVQLRQLGIYLRSTIDNPTTAVDAIVLNQPTLALVHGGATATLSVVFTPSDATNQNVTWSTSNAAIATVDANGVVTPVAAGVAAITATSVDGGYTADCTVTVS